MYQNTGSLLCILNNYICSQIYNDTSIIKLSLIRGSIYCIYFDDISMKPWKWAIALIANNEFLNNESIKFMCKLLLSNV